MSYFFTSLIAANGKNRVGAVQVRTDSLDKAKKLTDAVVQKAQPGTLYQAQTSELPEKETGMDLDRLYTPTELKALGY